MEYRVGQTINENERICRVHDGGNYNPVVTSVLSLEGDNLRNTYSVINGELRFVSSDPLTEKQYRNYLNKIKK